jgi:hypothetical protein
VVDLLGAAPAGQRRGTTRAVFTSGHAPVRVLARFGIGAAETASTS